MYYGTRGVMPVGRTRQMRHAVGRLMPDRYTPSHVECPVGVREMVGRTVSGSLTCAGLQEALDGGACGDATALVHLLALLAISPGTDGHVSTVLHMTSERESAGVQKALLQMVCGQGIRRGKTDLIERLDGEHALPYGCAQFAGQMIDGLTEAMEGRRGGGFDRTLYGWGCRWRGGWLFGHVGQKEVGKAQPRFWPCVTRGMLAGSGPRDELCVDASTAGFVWRQLEGRAEVWKEEAGDVTRCAVCMGLGAGETAGVVARATTREGGDGFAVRLVIDECVGMGDPEQLGEVLDILRSGGRRGIRTASRLGMERALRTGAYGMIKTFVEKGYGGLGPELEKIAQGGGCVMRGVLGRLGLLAKKKRGAGDDD